MEWETHDAQNVVPFVAWEFDSPLGHSTQVGQCSAEPHKLGLPGATPGPATWRVTGQARQNGRVRKRKSGEVESLVIL